MLGVLVTLFASYCTANFLSDAVNGLLPTSAIGELTFLKVLISLEVLIPASLYVAVILAFARLHGEAEVAAMYSLRMTPGTMFRAVLAVSGCLALVVGGLSLVVRPWAYQKLHALSGEAATLLDVGGMVAGSFYVGENGTRVIVLAHRDGPGSPARDVFVRLQYRDRTDIIAARHAYTLPNMAGSGPEVYLSDANIYEIDRANGQPDEFIQAKGYTLDPNSGKGEPPEYSAVAASDAQLVASSASADVAELEWRLSTPLSTLLLGLMGMPLSRTKPRQSRYAQLGGALLIYVGYYLLFTSARTWVQHGVIAPVPGVWWVPALLTMILLFAACQVRPRRLRRARRRVVALPSMVGAGTALRGHDPR